MRSIKEISAKDWDRLANPEGGRALNPFLTHRFLAALEESGSVGDRTGWTPLHGVLEPGAQDPGGADAEGSPTGVMPLYVKSHSQGEYVFDYAWADAYERAGGRYYPKLQSSVPFTPVTGKRLLVGDGPGALEREAALAAAARQLTERLGFSSLHITFADGPSAARLAEQDYLLRTDQQFHWENNGYESFDDFLEALSSRKRKNIRKERKQAMEDGITVRWLTGSDLREEHWDAFYTFYLDTGSRKWGTPYLNRQFFSLIGEAMPEVILLILCYRGQMPIGGALNFIGRETLYGRYWGAVEHQACLHFEACYYQAIDFAIAHKLRFVEAGAQGTHKLARGYMPVETRSLHWIVDPGFREAVARYLVAEREDVEAARKALSKMAPFKASPDQA